MIARIVSILFPPLTFERVRQQQLEHARVRHLELAAQAEEAEALAGMYARRVLRLHALGSDDRAPGAATLGLDPSARDFFEVWRDHARPVMPTLFPGERLWTRRSPPKPPETDPPEPSETPT